MNAMAARKRRKQLGAAGIEFVFVFVIFFGVFYAIISYAFVNLLYQSLIQASAEGARAVAKLDASAFANQNQFINAAKIVAKAQVTNSLGWLPQTYRDKITAGNGIDVTSTVSQVTYTSGTGATTASTSTITVKVTYPNYAANPLLPLLSLPGLGPIPNITGDLVGSSIVRIPP